MTNGKTSVGQRISIHKNGSRFETANADVIRAGYDESGRLAVIVVLAETPGGDRAIVLPVWPVIGKAWASAIAPTL